MVLERELRLEISISSVLSIRKTNDERAKKVLLIISLCC